MSGGKICHATLRMLYHKIIIEGLPVDSIVSATKLADICGVSMSTINKYIPNLVDMGLLELVHIERRTGRRIYKLLIGERICHTTIV